MPCFQLILKMSVYWLLFIYFYYKKQQKKNVISKTFEINVCQYIMDRHYRTDFSENKLKFQKGCPLFFYFKQLLEALIHFFLLHIFVNLF